MVLNKEWMFPKLELYSYHINSNPAWAMNYSKQVRGAWLDFGCGWVGDCLCCLCPLGPGSRTGVAACHNIKGV